MRPDFTMSLTTRFYGKILKANDPSGCWTWIGARNPKGYGRIHGIGNRTLMAHRVSYELLVGPIPAGMLVCHRCDNPSCVNPAHLFLGEPKVNITDMMAKGRNGFRRHRGDDIPWKKLTSDQVRQIRRRYADGGATYVGLATEYGVSKSAIMMILTRRNWADLE